MAESSPVKRKVDRSSRSTSAFFKLTNIEKVTYKCKYSYMSKSSERVKSWRKDTKNAIVEGFGGKCCICGYSKCEDALDLHHLDPSKKNFTLGGIRAHPKNWKIILKELENCILLCANCHREFHAGKTKLPDIIPEFVDIKEKRKLKTYCPVCNKLKKNYLITCSRSCAAKKTCTVSWENFDLFDLHVNQRLSNVKIADIVGVSDIAVIKRLKKLKIYNPIKNLKQN